MKRGARMLAGAIALAFALAPAAWAGGDEQRIVGGSETTIEEWPWQVLVTDDSSSFFCGGSLVEPNVVLTAAHCAVDPVHPDRVAAGYTDLADLDPTPSGTQEIHAVDEVVVSPSYDPDDPVAGGDWALLRLHEDSTLTPIALATPGDSSLYQAGDLAWTTGYGLTDGNPQTGTTVLHEVELVLADCGDLGASNTLFFCVSGTSGTCSGDSGGPLMIDAGSGVFRQIGVTSFGDQNCEQFHVWTNIVSDTASRNAIDAQIAEWTASAPLDSDGDGVPDDADQCPSQPGPASNNGCPLPEPDTDGDGVPDSSDQCPSQPGPASNNGCPTGGGGGGGGGGTDTTAPETTITKAPKKKIKTRKKRVKVTIEFNSNEAGSSFSCKLDDGAPKDCTSPTTFKVKKGKHTFTVAATDAAGNKDASADTTTWKVKRKR